MVCPQVRVVGVVLLPLLEVGDNDDAFDDAVDVAVSDDDGLATSKRY